MKIFTIIVIALFVINIIGYLYFKFMKAKGKYIDERKTTPFAMYPEVKLLGRTYHSRILNAERFSQFLDLVREYIKLTNQEDERDYALGFDATITTQNYPYLKGKLQFQEMYILHNADNTYYIGDSDETYFLPYCITFHDKFLPQNYFITYLPYYQKIEILTHDLPEYTDKTPFEQQVKEQIQALKTIEDYRIIKKMEQSFDGFYQFIEEAVVEYRGVTERQQAEKRAKLFAETDVLQRAKALYDLLKIPQRDQEEIYKQITDEDKILNFGLVDYNYLAWEEIGWQDKDDINAEDLFSKYGFYNIWSRYHEKSAGFTDEFAYMSGLGHQILQYGKTLCCFVGFVHKYVIIDSHDRAKLNAIVQGLKKNHEIDGIVFFDEVGQIYPLPMLDIFEQIEYKIKTQRNRTISDVRRDLIKVNDYLLGDCVPDTIDAFMPIFTDIKVEWKLQNELYNFDEKFVLELPKNGFSFVNLCFLLEQKIAQLTQFNNDTFSIQSFELGYDNQPIFILELHSLQIEKQKKIQGFKALTLVCTGQSRAMVMEYFKTKRVQKLNKNDEIIYDFIDYQQGLDCSFIIHLDWKSPIEELDAYLGEVLKNCYPKVKVKLPTAKDFDEEDAVGTEGIFVAYDKALRKVGLQFGFFDTQSDDYLIVVHKITDQENVEKIFDKIGYGYLGSEDMK